MPCCRCTNYSEFSDRKRRLVDDIALRESGPVERNPKQPVGVPVVFEVASLNLDVPRNLDRWGSLTCSVAKTGTLGATLLV